MNELTQKTQEIIEKEEMQKENLPWYMQPLSFDECISFLKTIPSQREFYRDNKKVLITELELIVKDLKE